MLDAMRNAHIQLVVGSPQDAMGYLEDAFHAHVRLDSLFHVDRRNEAMAGRVLHQVIGQRMAALCDFARETLYQPVPTHEVVAMVTRPLDPMATIPANDIGKRLKRFAPRPESKPSDSSPG
jgi:hypothetical protein